MKNIELTKPIFDYARTLLAPIIASGAAVYALDQLYPDFLVIDLTIFNSDATTTMKYKLNNQDALTLPASSMISYQNIPIWKVEIVSGGTYEIQLFGIKRDLVMK